MVEKVVQKTLSLIVLIAILVSVGFLYIKYIVQHDYEILYLNEQERELFLIEQAAEAGEEAPTVDEVENGETTSEDGVEETTENATTTDVEADTTKSTEEVDDATE